MRAQSISALNEAAAQLIQLDATATDELKELRSALEDLALEGGLPPIAQARVAGAARALARVMSAEGDTAADALLEAGQYLEMALTAIDTVMASTPSDMSDESGAPNTDSTDAVANDDTVAPDAEPVEETRPPVAIPDFILEALEKDAASESATSVEDSDEVGAEESTDAAASLPDFIMESLEKDQQEPQSIPFEVDPTLFADFVTESREYMEEAEASLLELESDPGNAEAVNTVFRAFHTIKGTSGFLGLDTIAELAHHAESLFNRFREGELRCTGALADLSLRSVDALSALLNAAEAAVQGGEMALPDGFNELMRILGDPDAAGYVGADGGGSDVKTAALPTIERDAGPPAGPEAAENSSSRTARSGPSDAADSWVRVRTDRLDELINMVGELVIAHSMLAQDSSMVLTGDTELNRKVTHSGKIVRELQDLSVSMRMVPLKGVFQKMARLVRDTARKSGKEIEFVVEGEDTEIDRNMVDVIGDPLVHMIRNAVDHGIEKPDVRREAGKDEQGTVRLSAFHAGGNVVVELTDDGKGLNREMILSKAIQKGLVEADRVLADNEILELIFAPGFSTAEAVTDLSGRGVGMDVVKRNIEELRGRVEISSTVGSGTTFTIRLPLTLAVTDGMLVQVGGERYIIPTASIQQSFRPAKSELSTVVGTGEIVNVRGESLSILRLHRLFGVRDGYKQPSDGLLVIVGVGTQRCAVLVDELVGQYQAVAKPLGDGIGKIRGVAGSAILGDGRVGLILDVAELVTVARESETTPSAAAA